MRATIDIWTDLRAELRRIRAGEVWVVTYSIHKDVFNAFFDSFRDSFTFHILVDCGGICPSGLSDFGLGLTQIHDATLHAKLVLIEPRMAGHRPVAYFLTGNIRQSLVGDENLCVKTELSPGVTTSLIGWLRSVRTGGTYKHPFLLLLDIDSGTQRHIRCSSLGSAILAVLEKRKVDIVQTVLMAPWGCNFTVKRLCGRLTSMKKLVLYAGHNMARGDQLSNVWVANVPSDANCDITRFVQSKKSSSFIHAKAAMFRGTRRARPVTFIYIGSGNFTLRGFWDKDSLCPNIESGILLTGTGITSGRLAKWFTQKVIGSRQRWRRLAVPEGIHAHSTGSTDTAEEFTEDGGDLPQNGFERRRLTKLFSKALGSRRHVCLLRKLLMKPNRAISVRRRLERMLCSCCGRHGVHTRRVVIASTEIIERNRTHTRIGLLLDTDTFHGIYVVTDIPGKLPHSNDEKESLIVDLACFGDIRQSNDRNTPGRENGSRRAGGEKRLNVRFPYRDLFILRDNLRQCDNGEMDFIRKMKHKIAILDELGTLDDSQTNPDVPLWWRSILNRIIEEEC